MIKLVRPTVRSSHVCCLITCPSPTTWQMQHCLPPRRPFVRSCARLAVAALVAVRRPSAIRPRCPHLPLTACLPVPGRFSDSRRDSAAIDCPLFPRSRANVSGGHLSTCCLMKMAAASSLDRIHMMSAHQVLQPSVTFEINFFWF